MIYGEESKTWQTWKRRFLVFSYLVIALCITILPIWQKVGAQPTLLLIILYYWTLYRPDLLHIEQLVLISLIQDGLFAYPLGFSALRLLINYALLLTQKRILCQQRFLWIWGGFGIFAIIDSLIFAILLSAAKHEWVGVLPFMPGLLMTISIYPLAIWLINRFMMKHLSV